MCKVMQIEKLTFKSHMIQEEACGFMQIFFIIISEYINQRVIRENYKLIFISKKNWFWRDQTYTPIMTFMLII